MLDKVYSPKPVEEKWAKTWRETGRFHAEPKGDRDKRFVVVIPPPNVTGALHIGHALNNTLQDVLVRWHRLQGHPACWVPGTDHGGIATQNVMEKQLKAEKTSRQALGREKFLERMQAWTRDCKKTILGQLERLGCALDWQREAFTMDEPRSRSVVAAFKHLWDKGLVYRGHRMVNWCVRCGTALSDIEVEHEDRKGKLWHIRYPASDGGEGVVVATTRPETMLGDTAVAVNPADERFKGLAGKALKLPLTPHTIPVVADEMVDSSFGSGAVKVTPAHDPNDFEVWRRHPEIGTREVIGFDGKMTPAAGTAYAGLSREQARDKVLEDLAAQGLLVETKEHPHAVGVCYRCSQIIEPMLSWQWFVKMAPLAEAAAAAHEDGRFRLLPSSWDKPYRAWLEGIRDWNISRQIWWGHRMPVWYCLSCVGDSIHVYHGKVGAPEGSFDAVGEVTTAGKLAKAGRTVAEIEAGARYMMITVEAAVSGTGTRDGIAIQDEQPGPCATCKETRWLRDPDVLDTWFSSALWPFSVFGWPDKTPDLQFFYPTSALVTGYEILYLWVARMQMMGLELLGKAPFDTGIIHGIVRDKSGRKMSKSLGNVVDPLVMMDKYGTDAFRFSLLTQAHPGKDIPFAEDSITGARNFANKLWNSTRFVLMNLPERPPEGAYKLERLAQGRLELADRWILAEYQKALEDSARQLAASDPAAAADTLYAFLWDKFCDWYVELAKIRLQGTDGVEKEAARTVLTQVLAGTLKALHPFMPFITEELYEAVRPYAGETAASVLDSGTARLDRDRSDGEAVASMGLVMEAVTALRTLRAQLNVPPGLKVRVLAATQDDAAWARIDASAAYLKALARVETLERSLGARPPQSAGAVATGATFFVPLSGLIDFAKERARLEKESREVEAQLAQCAAQLSNEAFTSRAPREQVDTIRRRQTDFEAKRVRLTDILRSLS